VKLKLYIVGLTYAPYQVQVNVYRVWAPNAARAQFLAEMYRGEGSQLSDEWERDVSKIEFVSTQRAFQDWSDTDGWIGEGECPVKEVFHWSRG
jgi:hypothetical protein